MRTVKTQSFNLNWGLFSRPSHSCNLQHLRKCCSGSLVKDFLLWGISRAACLLFLHELASGLEVSFSSECLMLVFAFFELFVWQKKTSLEDSWAMYRIHRPKHHWCYIIWWCLRWTAKLPNSLTNFQTMWIVICHMPCSNCDLPWSALWLICYTAI